MESTPSRNGELTASVNRAPLLAIADLHVLARTHPYMAADIAAFAQRFFPRSGLGRMG